MWKNYFIFGLILIISCNSRMTVDLMIINGKIYTVNENFNVVESFVIKDGKILESGGIHEPEFFKRFFASMNKSLFLDENLPAN